MENPYPFARKELADFSLHSKRLTLSLCSLIAHTLCYGLGLFYLFLVLSLSNLISLYVMSLLPFDQHNGCNTHRSPKVKLIIVNPKYPSNSQLGLLLDLPMKWAEFI